MNHQIQVRVLKPKPWHEDLRIHTGLWAAMAHVTHYSHDLGELGPAIKRMRLPRAPFGVETVDKCLVHHDGCRAVREIVCG